MSAAPDVPLEDLLPSRRSDRVRARTISIKRLSKRDLERGRVEADALLAQIPEADRRRPERLSECRRTELGRPGQPCPFVSCEAHLYLDVSPRTGAIKLNFPDLEVWEMPVTCAYAVAGLSGETLELVGERMNVTRERVRQLETRALRRIRTVAPALREHLDREEARLDLGAAARAPGHRIRTGRPLTAEERAAGLAILRDLVAVHGVRGLAALAGCSTATIYDGVGRRRERIGRRLYERLRTLAATRLPPLDRDLSGAERIRCAIGARQLDAIDRAGAVEAWAEEVRRG